MHGLLSGSFFPPITTEIISGFFRMSLGKDKLFLWETPMCSWETVMLIYHGWNAWCQSSEKKKRWPCNSRADLSPLGLILQINVLTSSLLLPWIKNNSRASHSLPRAHTQGSTTSSPALGKKCDPETTELMEVGKSCQHSIYMWRVLSAAGAAWS